MVNNFNKILGFIDFSESDNVFMHLQIVQRAKDNPDKKVKEGALHTYFIRSREHLKRLMPEIINLCEFYHARAYINIAPKELDKVNKELMFQLALQSNLGNISNPRKLLNSAAGKVKSYKTRWIVDIDDTNDVDPVYNWFLTNTDLVDDIFLNIIPTVHGYHLIPDGFKFDIKKFNEKFPDIIVHKNSTGTLLYANVE